MINIPLEEMIIFQLSNHMADYVTRGRCDEGGIEIISLLSAVPVSVIRKAIRSKQQRVLDAAGR